jgi:hypothetical protein
MVGHALVLLPGRERLVVLFNLLFIAGVMGVAAVLVWQVNRPDHRPWLWSAVPWPLAAAIVGKFGVAAWALRTSFARGFLRWPMVLAIVAAATAVAASGTVLVALALPAAVPRVIAVEVAILLVPLGSLALAPLAVDWNRHR